MATYVISNFTLFQALSILFITVSSVAISYDMFFYAVYDDFYVNKTLPPVILTFAILCFLFTVVLIVGTHKVIIFF